MKRNSLLKKIMCMCVVIITVSASLSVCAENNIPDGYIKSTENALRSATVTHDGDNPAMPISFMTDGTTKQGVIGNNTYVLFTLDNPLMLREIRMKYYDRGGVYKISVAGEDQQFTPVVEITTNKGSSEVRDTGSIPLDGEYKYVKFERTPAGVTGIEEIEAYCIVPGIEIRSVDESIAPDEEVKLTLNGVFEDMNSKDLYMVRRKETQEKIPIAAVRADGKDVYIEFTDYLTANSEYEVCFTENSIAKYAEKSITMSAEKKEFKTNKKTISYKYDEEILTLTNNHETPAEVCVIFMDFSDTGVLLRTDVRSVTVDTLSNITYTKCDGAQSSSVCIFVKERDFYLPIGKHML